MIDPNQTFDPARIADNFSRVNDEVAAACDAAGRDRASVTVVGVSKYVDATTTAMLVAAGCKDLGENRPQVLWKKHESGLIDDAVQWHLIGHLQRNKAARLLRRDVVIHSVDSVRVFDAIAEASLACDRETKVLLELNVSGEEAKTGMESTEMEQILSAQADSQSATSGIKVIGLMAMAGWGTDADEARRQFAAVRDFRDQVQQRLGVSLPELSMGMSGDFEAAIAEGATLVRIGSRLFE